jgi:PIN domain nuclease of toxin-antitoxin system
VDLLLDTCAIVWLSAEPARLSKKARLAIDADDAKLFASDASTWEVCLKWQATKLVLPAPPRQWLAEQARIWQTVRLALDLEHFYRTTELPPLHKDPFDRLLVAQAIDEGLTIVTPDPAIRAYPVSVLW